MQLTVSVVDANSAKEAMEPVPLVHSGSDRLFKQRNPLDMVLVAVPFRFRWAVRTEKSAWYGVCGCPFRAPMGYSNREIRLVWCLWLSLPGSDGLFEQRNPLDIVLVAVPFDRGMSHGSGTGHVDRFHGSLILSHFHAA